MTRDQPSFGPGRYVLLILCICSITALGIVGRGPLASAAIAMISVFTGALIMARAA